MRRLGSALVEHIRLIDASAKFIVVEAAQPDLAEAMAEFWDTDDLRLPKLAIASGEPKRFGKYGLKRSAANLRHSDGAGLCVVVCEGFQLSERQSVNGFFPISPDDLLGSTKDLLLLAKAVKPVRLDGPMTAVREAIVTAPAAERPGATQVAAYLDAVAAGGEPMGALPILGAFRDPDISPADVRSDRVKENIALALTRRSDTMVRPAIYTDIRSRAHRILGRRSSGDGEALSAGFMSLLQSGSDDILGFVTFDEAREILTAGAKGLPARVRQELADYRRSLGEDADVIPWDEYRTAADALERTTERKDAARNLLDFDAAEAERVFSGDTRKKLQNLLRDRIINATPGSAPEVGIARAIRSLGSRPTRITLSDPHPALPATSQSAARDWLALAVTRVRLAALLRRLETTTGCEIDGLLVVEAFDGLDDHNLRDLFVEAGLDRGGALPAVRIKVHGPSGSVELSWAPDLDDAGLLRSLVEFSEASVLSLRLDAQPDAINFAAASADSIEFASPPSHTGPLAEQLHLLAKDVIRDGLKAERLRAWVALWREDVESARGFRGGRAGESAATAGCIEGPSTQGQRVVGMSPLAPLKAEWLADYVEAARILVDEAMHSVESEVESALAAAAFDVSADGFSRATASHCPAFLRVVASDEPLLPSQESRVWTTFGGQSGFLTLENQALAAVHEVLLRLLRLQPEVAGDVRCLAVGPASADLLLCEAIALAGRRIEGAEVRRIQIFAVGPHGPDEAILAKVDEFMSSAESGGAIELRYLENLSVAAEELGYPLPGVHFALFTGLTADHGRPTVNAVEIEPPLPDSEVLFAPRVWQRPDTEQRILLVPPGPTEAGITWLRLGQAIDDRWPRQGGALSVPEMRTGVAAVADELREIHEIAMWVATLDRYATRDSIERALEDDVAILHQEQRLGAESPIGLVVSQKAGGPVDRAIGRSLRQARIMPEEAEAASLGGDLRRVATQGYGILALEAATSGTGINELVGHVVGFSMLGKTSTPWPLPVGSRVLLISLDEHPEWFLGQKRADLLALAIDTAELGVHGAVIEVKARRSDVNRAATEALDQLKKTLLATSFVAYPRPDSLSTRVWLNRITDAAYAVARESRIRLSAEELTAMESFRKGTGTLEWAGVGLVFAPSIEDKRRVHRQAVDGDWVPIAMHDVRLTRERLEDAVNTDLRELFTADAESAPLSGGRQRRRPETGVSRPEPRDEDFTTRKPDSQRGSEEARAGESEGSSTYKNVAEESVDESQEEVRAGASSEGSPPVLGWDQYTGQPKLWRVTGPGGLDNGHVQVWGSSGSGKTQFVKTLLAQLAHTEDTRFGVADFKNDYGPTAEDDFPADVGAQFLDLWGRPGAPYNPLSLTSLDDQAAIDSQIIEFRDCIEQAMASYQRIGTRQKQSVEHALRGAYRDAADEGRWPTMMDLNRHLSDDITHILGDLTRYEIFSDGPPLATVIGQKLIFGLNRIPGNGQTTVLAAAFLLSVISLAMQSEPPVTRRIAYSIVVDEAHRVAQFQALQLMMREGRSKGLAVILATQSPSDLPEVVDTNAQTRICFRLSDAVIAAQAARKLDTADGSLAERIRTLGTGEAFVSLQGGPPELLMMAQFYRDRVRLEQGSLLTPPT
jgi:hypothetical protein